MMSKLILPCPSPQQQHQQQFNSTAVTHDRLAQFGIGFGRVHGPLCLAVCAFGILANVANIVVLTRPLLSVSATNHLLFWLACADLFTMLLYVPGLYHFYIVRPNPMKIALHSPIKSWVVYQTVAVSCVIVLHSLAVWITVLLAVFRYLHIGFPTIGPRLATKRRALFSVLITAFCCVILVTPNAVINYVDACFAPADYNAQNYTSQGSTTLYYFIQSKLEEHDTESTFRSAALHAANFWIQATVFKLIPSFMLVILTALLIYELRAAAIRHRKLHRNTSLRNKSSMNQEERREKGCSQMNEKRTTNLLITILIIFLIVEMPQGLLMICLHQIDGFYENVYEHLGDFIDFTTLVKEAINFVIYTTMSTQFRQTFCQVFFIDQIIACTSKCAKSGHRPTTLQQHSTSVRTRIRTEDSDENAELMLDENKTPAAC